MERDRSLSLTSFSRLCFKLLHLAVCTSNLLLVTAACREASHTSEDRTGSLVASTQDL